MSTFEVTSDYSAAPFLAEQSHAPLTSPVELFGQLNYVTTALQITEEVREHGDAIENTTNAPWVKTFGFAAVAGYEVSQVMSPIAESYSSLPNVLGLSAGYLVMNTLNQHYVHKLGRAHSQLRQQRTLAVQSGEELEFFNEPKKTIGVRWFGAHGDVSKNQSFAERADKVAEIVSETGTDTVHVSPEIAKLLGVDQPSATEYEWAKKAKQVLTPQAPRRLQVVSVPADDFLEKAAELFEQQPVVSDTVLLRQCLDFICAQKPKANFAKLYGAKLDLENPAQIRLLTKALGQQVQALLDDVDAIKIDHTTTKIHSHGVLAPTTVRTASNPAIDWYGDGAFRGSQRLLSFIGTDTEGLQAVMLDHAPKDKYQAALILAYIESQKAAKGINVTPMVENQQEGPPQPVFQGNLGSLGTERNYSNPNTEEVMIIKLSPHRVGKALLKGLILLGALNIAMQATADSRGAFGPNAVLTPVDNVVSKVPNWINEKLGEPDVNTGRGVNDGLSYGESSRIGFNGMPGNREDNAPLWFIESTGEVTSAGYWLTSTNHTMDLREDWYGWYGARPNDEQPADRQANLGRDGFDENNPFPDGNGLAIRRTIDLSALDNGSLYLPIQAHSNLLRVKMTDTSSGIDYWPDMYQQVDGPIYIRPDDHLDVWSMPTTSKLKITYWLTSGGNDGVGKAINTVNVVEGRSGLRDVDEASLDQVWEETIPGFTHDKATAFLGSKDYSLTPAENQKYATETDLLKSIVSDDSSDCNRANTALVLSDPSELNLAGGFYNEGRTEQIDALSSHERHGYTVDKQGKIFDATPYSTTGGQQVADYFKEDYYYAPTKQEIEETGNRTAQITVGLMGLLVVLAAGGFTTSLASAQHRKRAFAKIDDQAAQEARDVLDHIFYGGNSPFVPSQAAKPKQQTVKDIRQMSGVQLTRKQIRTYDRRQNAVPKRAIKTARFLSRY